MHLEIKECIFTSLHIAGEIPGLQYVHSSITSVSFINEILSMDLSIICLGTPSPLGFFRDFGESDPKKINLGNFDRHNILFENFFEMFETQLGTLEV